MYIHMYIHIWHRECDVCMYICIYIYTYIYIHVCLYVYTIRCIYLSLSVSLSLSLSLSIYIYPCRLLVSSWSLPENFGSDVVWCDMLWHGVMPCFDDVGSEDAIISPHMYLSRYIYIYNIYLHTIFIYIERERNSERETVSQRERLRDIERCIWFVCFDSYVHIGQNLDTHSCIYIYTHIYVHIYVERERDIHWHVDVVWHHLMRHDAAQGDV